MDQIEPLALDYLFHFFLDKPAFDKAVQAALPSGDDRERIIQEIDKLESRKRKSVSALQNIAKAIAGGAAFDELLREQKEHAHTRDTISKRLEKLHEDLAAHPDPSILQRESEGIRQDLEAKFRGRDWRELPHEEIQAFLTFLFGGSPSKQGYGLRITQTGKREFQASIRGRFDFAAQPTFGVDANLEINATITEDREAQGVTSGKGSGVTTGKHQGIQAGQSFLEIGGSEAKAGNPDNLTKRSPALEFVACLPVA